MMKLTIIMTLVSLHSVIYAQDGRGYWDLIEGRIKRLQFYGKIYYSDRLPDEIIEKSSKTLSKKGVKRLTGKSYRDEYTLSKLEWQTVRRELRSSLFNKLPDNLFDSSKSVPIDSINQLVETFNNTVRDSVVNHPTTYAKILKWAFYFSKPIYLRNNTLLFYFFMYYRCSSGSYSYYLSKLKNGHWEKGINIGGGAW